MGLPIMRMIMLLSQGLPLEVVRSLVFSANGPSILSNAEVLQGMGGVYYGATYGGPPVHYKGH